MAAIRVVLPAHLRTLARVTGELMLHVDEPVHRDAVLSALETSYPVLRGTIRDHGTLRRRPFIRFFACGEDMTLTSGDERLPDSVVAGREPYLVVGAMAGG